MPLIKGKSKQSFKSNMESEMDAGKPKDQSLAIAYSIQRKARSKSSPKKMADGGMIESMGKENYKEPMSQDMVDDQSSGDGDSDLGVIESIRAKNRQQMDSDTENMAEGGEVGAHGAVDDYEDPASLSPYDEQNEVEGDKKYIYDSEQLSPQPMSGDEHGDDDDYRDEGFAKSLVARIRERMKNRRGF